MQKYVSAGLEFYAESAQTVLVYLVETDLQTGDKSVLAGVAINDRSTDFKLTENQNSYEQIAQNAIGARKDLLPISDFATSADLPFDGFLAFRNTDARVAILDAGYNWLLTNMTKDLEEPDLRIEDDRYEIHAKARRTAGPRGRSGESIRPRRSKQNYKIWI